MGSGWQIDGREAGSGREMNRPLGGGVGQVCPWLDTTGQVSAGLWHLGRPRVAVATARIRHRRTAHRMETAAAGWGILVDVSIGEKLVAEHRRRRRAGDARLTDEDRALLRRVTTGDLVGEFQAGLDAVSDADPLLGGGGTGDDD